MEKIKRGMFFCLIIVFYSCSKTPIEIENNPNNNQEIGKVAFQFDMSTSPSEVVSLAGIIFQNGYNSIEFNINIGDTTNTASALIENVPVGEWNLRVDALNSDSIVVYSGITSLLVQSGVVTPVNLFLNPTTGSIIIDVQWGDYRSLSDLDEYLIGYWDFDDHGIYDLSSNYNHGTVFGNASFLPGKKGNAINFMGYDGYAEIPDDTSYYSNEKTISFWMYKNNSYILETVGKNDGEGLLAKAYDTGLERDFAFVISNNNPNFNIYGFVGTEADTLIVTGKTQAIAPQNWYHCVLVVGKNYTEFYLNGKLTETNFIATHPVNTNAPIVIGKLSTATLTTRYFNGKIDEFRIYNKSFSEEEIQLLYYDAL